MNEPLEHDYAPVCNLYERHLGPALFKPYAIDLVQRGITDCMEGSVLEMACGTGILTQQLRTRLKPTVSLTATDINPGMLAYAQRKLADVEGIVWRQADIADLPFPDASFDIAVCQFGLMFVRDKDRAFQEIRRVLTKHGVLAFSVWDRIEMNPWSVAVQDMVAAFFQDDPPQFFKAPFSCADVGELYRLLTANGFDQAMVQTIPKECFSNTARALAIGMIEGSPILNEIQERGGSPGPIIDAVTNVFARIGGRAPFRSTMQALVATARAKERQ